MMSRDLNLSLGASKIWGPKAVVDPLADFFQDKFEEKELIDIELVRIKPTWRNKRVEEE